jgi:hypothetical protein
MDRADRPTLTIRKGNSDLVQSVKVCLAERLQIDTLSLNLCHPGRGSVVERLQFLFPPLRRPLGAPSFALFAKGGIPRISMPTVAYPTLCKERKGWGTRLFVARPAVPNTNRGIIENLFLSDSRTRGNYWSSRSTYPTGF